MVEVDACVGPEFLSHNVVRFCGPARQTCDVNVIQEGTQLLITRQSCLGFDEGLMLAQREEHGHEGIALLPSLPLCDVLQLVFPHVSRWAAVKHAHKGEDLISALHPQKAFQHSAAGDQIVRSHPVNGCDGDLRIEVRRGLHAAREQRTHILPLSRGRTGKELWLLPLSPQSASRLYVRLFS